jgi:hypothetical protein
MSRRFILALSLLLACSVYASSMGAPQARRAAPPPATAAQEEGDENFLDLTKFKPAAPQPGTAGAPAVVQDTRFNPSTAGKRGPLAAPLKVTLERLDAGSYQLGDKVIYEVTMENVSQELQTIPWSPDENKVKARGRYEPHDYTDAFLGLVVKDKALGDQFVAVQGVYGSASVPGSLKTLLPGQKVRIRAQGQMFFAAADVSEKVSRKLSKSPLKLKVQARYSLHPGPAAPDSGPVVSANAETIELLAKQ